MGHQRTLRRTLGGPKIFKMLFAVSHSFADGHKALGDFRPRTDSLSRAEEIHRPVRSGVTLTFILLTWRIWWAPTSASKWQMGFNSAFNGLNEESWRRKITYTKKQTDYWLLCFRNDAPKEILYNVKRIFDSNIQIWNVTSWRVKHFKSHTEIKCNGTSNKTCNKIIFFSSRATRFGCKAWRHRANCKKKNLQIIV